MDYKEYYSAIEKYDERDYLAWDELKEKNKKTNRVKKIHQYNQKLVDDYSCTTHAATWVISDFTGHKFSLSFIKAVFERQKKTTFKEWVWDYFSNWIKQAVKEYNAIAQIEDQLEYARIPLTEENIKKVIDSGSWAMCGYKWRLYQDAQDNWVIDNPDNPNGGGHCIRIVKYFYFKGVFHIKYVDNYEGVNHYNIITVPDIEKNKDFFKGLYYVRFKK